MCLPEGTYECSPQRHTLWNCLEILCTFVNDAFSQETVNMNTINIAYLPSAAKAYRYA